MQHLAVLGEDDVLLAAARSGDDVSFERLIEPHLGIAYRLATAMLADRVHAEDAVQDALLRAWKSLGQLRSSSQVRAWFLTIVANRSRSIRSSRSWSMLRWPTFRSSWASPAESVEEREDLTRAYRRLTPDERAVIYLRFYEGMESREVALALGISGTAARSRIHRALQRLRIELSEEDR